jgi:hypothetical protein
LRRRMRRVENTLSRFSGERVHRRDAILGIDKNLTCHVAEKKWILRRAFEITVIMRTLMKQRDKYRYLITSDQNPLLNLWCGHSI